MGLRLLLDSHAVYRALTSPEELSDGARAAVPDPTNDVLVSAASIYELTFKTAIGKLHLGRDLVAAVEAAGFTPLPVTPRHAFAAASLPLHHRDPWDRLLVAQAQLEGLTIVTSDQQIARYDVAVLPA